MRPYFQNYLIYVELAPFQMQTNAYRILAALKYLYHLHEWGEPSPEEIFYLLSLKKNPLRAHGGEGFYYLASWPQEKRLFKDMPNKPLHFKDKFFLTGTLSGSLHCSFNRAYKYFYLW